MFWINVKVRRKVDIKVRTYGHGGPYFRTDLMLTIHVKVGFPYVIVNLC